MIILKKIEWCLFLPLLAFCAKAPKSRTRSSLVHSTAKVTLLSLDPRKIHTGFGVQLSLLLKYLPLF